MSTMMRAWFISCLPIHAVLALHEAVVDELAAQGRVVVEEALEDLADLALAVTPVLELAEHPFEHDLPLAVGFGNLLDLSVHDERLEDTRLGRIAARARRRTHQLRRLEQALVDRLQRLRPRLVREELQ